MSFVLDALKRQEADGNPDAAVALATATSARQRHRFWRALFAAAMLVNVLVLAWFGGLADWFDAPPGNAAAVPGATLERPAAAATGGPTGAAGTPAPMAAPAAPTPPAVAAPASAPSGAPISAARAPAAAAPTDAAPEQAGAPVNAGGKAELPAAPPARAPAQPEVQRLALGDLPDDARRRLPGMVFSTHVYADDPDLRAVVANGQRLTEGQRIRGLEILEITEGGVVLAFERYEVEVPIVTDWD